MQCPNDSGVDRVRAVLGMRVENAGDLLRFSASIADFSGEELIRLAGELPKYGGWFGYGSIIRPGKYRSNR